MIGVLRAMMVTMRTALRKPVTRQYPDYKPPIPAAAKGYPFLTWDVESESPYCIGCGNCERYCPVDCITTVGPKSNPKYRAKDHDTTCLTFLRDGVCLLHSSPRKTIIEKFWIDFNRCMKCNICVEVCPTDSPVHGGKKAIVLDRTRISWELSRYTRDENIFDLEQLLAPSKAGKLETFDPEKRNRGEEEEPFQEEVFKLRPPSFGVRVRSAMLRIKTKISPHWRRVLRENPEKER